MLSESSFTKLTIWAYSDSGYKTLVGPPYIALINPESYETRYKVETSRASQAQGQNDPKAVYVKTPPQCMNFSFLFDVTGAIIGLNPASAFEPISYQIDSFLKLTCKVNGENHQPNFLKLIWGDTIFKGIIKDVTVENKLFDNTGRILRAIVKCVFESSGTESIVDALSQLSSPDLTHQRTIKQGDTLPLLCYQIYGSSSYYYDVAKVNGITNFRKLQVGSTVYFPPLTKQ